MSPTVVPGVSSVARVFLIGVEETRSEETDLCERLLRFELLLAGTTKAVAVDAIAARRVREMELNLMVFLRL